ncbi:MAG: tetratricopeptide repeat protein, partial [Planctomycetes bacterium]|nr:tetratricopeptide repeat protein [Planctomycetota bacterium]
EPVAFEYAAEIATRLQQLAPDDVQNALIMGRVYEDTFALDQAFSHYQKLLNGPFRGYPAPRIGMARILRRFGLNAEAEQQLRLAVATLATDAESLAALGILLLDTGRAIEATPLLVRADALFPRRDVSVALEAGLALGRAYLAQGNWPKASSSFSSSLRTARSIEAPEAIRASAGITAAAYLSGDFEKASTLAQEAVTEFGSDPQLLYLRGITVAAMGGPAAEVVRDLRASISGAPLDAALAYSALAFWLDVLGDAAEAQMALDASIELNPVLPYSRYLQARWASRNGDVDAARAGLLDFVSEFPDCSAALADLAALLAEAGSLDAAEVAMARAEAGLPQWVQNAPDAPQWANVVLRRGLNQNAQRDYETSQASFARAISLDEDLFAARNATALTFYAQGDLPAAIAEWGYLQDSLRSNELHAQAVYAKLWQERVEAHSRLRRWLDPFEGNRFRPGWDAQTDARLGVEPRVIDGVLRIKGDHSGAGQTRAYRQTPALAFRKFAGELTTGSNHKGTAGLFISLANRRAETWYFRVFRDREGALNWAWKQGAKNDSKRLPLTLAAEESLDLSFTLNRESLPPVLSVHADGAILWQGPVPALRSSSGKVSMGVFAETSLALPVDVSLDSVEVIHSQL